MKAINRNKHNCVLKQNAIIELDKSANFKHSLKEVKIGLSKNCCIKQRILIKTMIYC